MDNSNVPTKIYIMVSHMLNLAVKKEVSWTIFALFLEEISSTLLKSKQVIKILLKEFENFTENNDKPLRNFFNDENLSEHEDHSEIETLLICCFCSLISGFYCPIISGLSLIVSIIRFKNLHVFVCFNQLILP